MSCCKYLNLAHHHKWNINDTANWEPYPLIQLFTSCTLVIVTGQARDHSTLTTELGCNKVYIGGAETKLTGDKNNLDEDFARFTISFKAHLWVGVATDTIRDLDKQSCAV